DRDSDHRCTEYVVPHRENGIGTGHGDRSAGLDFLRGGGLVEKHAAVPTGRLRRVGLPRVHAAHGITALRWRTSASISAGVHGTGRSAVGDGIDAVPSELLRP